jgi:Uma2 family endonuclease
METLRVTPEVYEGPICEGPWRYDHLLQMPEDPRWRFEILDGELFVTPSPRTIHQRVLRNLAFWLLDHIEKRGLGELLWAPLDVVFGPKNVCEPDILFVSKRRAKIVADRGLTAAPDLAVEILSETTEEKDRGRKLRTYARFGVRHYWIVDPRARTVEELVLRGKKYVVRTVARGPVRFRPALFPRLAIDLGRVWR